MKTVNRLAILLVGCVLVLSTLSCGHKSHSPLASSLDSLFTPVFGADGADAPGAIVLVAVGDSIIYDRAYGMADLARRTAVTDSTLLNICSISKQYAAVALLKLEEEGRLSLNDSVAKFFPEFRSPRFKEIRLWHLLSHTSGIPDIRPRNRQQWHQYLEHHRSRFASNHDYRAYSLYDESTAYLHDLDTFAFAPGTAYEYQNPTFQLVLPLVERLTGREYVSWMNDNIFGPAGLDHTIYFDPAIHDYPLAHAYRPAEGDNKHDYWRSPDGRWEECDYGEANFFPTKTDGGIFTSALDFLKWQRQLFGGNIISPRQVEKATTPVIATDIPDTGYGLGFFIEEREGKPRKIFHTGDNGGFLTVEAYFPESEVFYLIFANRPDWPREQIYEKVDSILLDHGVIPDGAH